MIPSLAQQYSAPPDEDPDEIEPNPVVRVTMTAEQILDRYIQAIGGAAAAAKLTSYTAKGTYEGFDSDFEQVAGGCLRQGAGHACHRHSHARGGQHHHL